MAGVYILAFPDFGCKSVLRRFFESAGIDLFNLTTFFVFSCLPIPFALELSECQPKIILNQKTRGKGTEKAVSDTLRF